ncbi:N-acetyltransferase family protein [Marimonas sp. MJW-29]|uniref:N-acetyltransferase family protein n=1 Tax=Sulfitobacter sediminis TaxID=3234186 RepID=A0ABV3RI01_9RHOB
MTHLIVRPITPDDLTAVLFMVRALAAHHEDIATLTPETLARDALGDPPWMRVLVTERRGDLVGYAALCPLAQLQFGVRGMDMHHLFVAEQARGSGVGRALIDASLALCRAEGCRYMTVGTHPENTAAAAVYRAAGFEDLPPPGPRFRMKLAG